MKTTLPASYVKYLDARESAQAHPAASPVAPTPAPWRVVANNEIAAGNKLIAITENANNGHANAKAIVRAVNSHAQLVAALNAVRESGRIAPLTPNVMGQVQQALIAAGSAQ